MSVFRQISNHDFILMITLQRTLLGNCFTSETIGSGIVNDTILEFPQNFGSGKSGKENGQKMQRNCEKKEESRPAMWQNKVAKQNAAQHHQGRDSL